MNMPFMGKCAIYGQMCHFWINVLLLVKCAIYGQMCHLWANVLFIYFIPMITTKFMYYAAFCGCPLIRYKCVIYGQMCHIWIIVPYMGKCAINAQMCHLLANVSFMGKFVIYGQMCHLWANVPFMGKGAIYRLEGRKGAFFQVQGPVQGPREEVQGPYARASEFPKTLNHVVSSILLRVHFH